MLKYIIKLCRYKNKLQLPINSPSTIYTFRIGYKVEQDLTILMYTKVGLANEFQSDNGKIGAREHSSANALALVSISIVFSARATRTHTNARARRRVCMDAQNSETV